MKSTGIVRKMDELGRIVLPVEIRSRLELEAGVGVEIFFEGDSVTLKKYQDKCTICGETSDLVDFKGKKVCKGCIEDLSDL